MADGSDDADALDTMGKEGGREGGKDGAEDGARKALGSDVKDIDAEAKSAGIKPPPQTILTTACQWLTAVQDTQYHTIGGLRTRIVL